MKKWILAFGLMMGMMQSSHADDCQGAMTATLNNMNDAANYGKAVANNCKDQAIKSTIEQNATRIAQEVDANYDHSNAQYYDKDLNVSLFAGNQKVNKCSGDLSGLSNKDKADCEAVEFAAKSGNQRPQYTINKDKDPLINDSKDTINQANITGKQNFCRVVKQKVPATYERKQCMVTTGTQHETCKDTASTKGCIEETNEYRVSAGGILKGSDRIVVTSELPTRMFFGGKRLNMQLNGHDRHRVGAHVAEYGFVIKNLEAMDRAVITRYYRDDGLRVWVNGHLIIDDGYGREAVRTAHPNKDIKPYLQEGSNTIKVDLYNNTRHAILDLQLDIPVWRGCTPSIQSTCSVRQKSPMACQVKRAYCQEPSTKDFSELTGILDGKAMGMCKTKVYELTCSSELNVSECSKTETQGCEQIGSECTEKDAQGRCLTYNQIYQCQKTPERVVETTQCEEMLCHGDNCVPQKADADGDFGMAIAMLETQRQAGMYGKTPRGYNIFDGDPSVCSVKVLAGHNLMSCCKEISTGDKFKNRTQGGNTVTYGNEPNTPLTDPRGSQYVYDKVFDQNETLSVIQSTATLGWLQCNNEEKTLAIKRGSGLCEYSHEWCSKKTFFGSCIEKKRQYCCFRSVLAKVINKQGNAQLGKGGCDGFTLEELQKLDFSKMDFSEFINQIVPADIDVDIRKKQVGQSIEKKFSKEVNYYDR